MKIPILKLTDDETHEIIKVIKLTDLNKVFKSKCPKRLKGQFHIWKSTGVSPYPECSLCGLKLKEVIK